MRIRTLHREQWVPGPLAEVFAFFCEARNLDRITPPWLHFRVLSQTGFDIRAGTLVHYRLAWHGMPLNWTSRIEDWRPPCRFIDLQMEGPYHLWHHTHRFEANNGGTLISDTVRYAVPLGIAGDFLAGWLVRRDLEQIFDYRSRAIAAIFGKKAVSTEPGQHVHC